MIRLALAALFLVASGQAATIPRPTPEFVIKTSTGTALLSQLRGKVVLLAFIHTTCPHCQNSVGLMSQLQSEYGSRGFQAIASAFNELARNRSPSSSLDSVPRFP